MASHGWEMWLNESLVSLTQSELLRSLRPLKVSQFSSPPWEISDSSKTATDWIRDKDFQTFEKLGPWDRQAVEVELSEETFQMWLNETPSTGDEVCALDTVLRQASGLDAELSRKLVLFSGNDYLGLSAHPTVRSVAAKAALEFGIGPRGSPLVCGYTYHHRMLELALADLKHTEECLLCPTGFAANMAVMNALCTVMPRTSALKSSSTFGQQENVVDVFSDEFNHASIIDGVRIARRQGNTDVKVYKHCDMEHLEQLLAQSKHERKVVVTDSLFSMDGDFAPLKELAALRRKYGFILVVDDAHGTLVCGEGGEGAAQAFGVQDSVDIQVGTLSKAFGCHGGFIASSRKWKQLIMSKGRSFIFSTSLPVPIAAAAHAAIVIAKREKWRQEALWDRVRQFSEGTGLQFVSPIAPIILGSANETLAASRDLLKKGFHVSAIRPPTVPNNFSRLRIALSAAHTVADVQALISALPLWTKERQYSLPRSISCVSCLPFSLRKGSRLIDSPLVVGKGDNEWPSKQRKQEILFARSQL